MTKLLGFLSVMMLWASLASAQIFVDSTNGSDSNNCLSSVTACQTVGHALTLGNTLLLAAGAYPEEITISKPTSLKTTDGTSDAYFDGGISVTNWTNNGDGTWSATLPYTSLIPTSSSTCQSCLGTVQYAQYAMYPDAVHEVTVSGSDKNSLMEVCNPSGPYVTPTAGQFCIQYNTSATRPGTVTIGDDPTGQNIEVSRYQVGITFTATATGSSMDGIGVTRYADNYNATQHGAILVAANNVSIIRLWGGWNSNRSINAQAVTGFVLMGSDIENNREGGVAGASLTNAVISNNVISNNNSNQLFAVDWDASGLKLSRGVGNQINGNTMCYNGGPGFWEDYEGYNLVVAGNMSCFNMGHGIDVEKSGWSPTELGITNPSGVTWVPSIIANNVSVGNNQPTLADSQVAGISAANDGHLEIWNNTLGGNGVANSGNYTALKIVDSDAHPIPPAAGNQVFNNILAQGFTFPVGGGGDFDLFYNHEYAGENGQIGTQMVSASDFNMYWQDVGPVPPYVIGWDLTTTKPTQFATLAAFQAEVPNYEMHSLMASSLPYNTSYQCTTCVPGAPLPADIAAVMGVPAGTVPNIGAFGMGNVPTPSPSPSPSPSVTPTPTPSVSPTATPTVTPTATPTVTPTPSPIPTPSPTPSPVPTPTPSGVPVVFIKPTNGQIITAQEAKKLQIKIDTTLTNKGSVTYEDNGTPISSACTNIRSMYCSWPSSSTPLGMHILTAMTFDDKGSENGFVSITVTLTQ